MKFLLCILVLWQTADEWYATGVRLAGSGKTAEAIDAYRQTVNLNPKHIEAWNNLGDLLRRSGDRQGAVDAIDHALQLNPNHPRARCWLMVLRFCIAAVFGSRSAAALSKIRPDAGDYSRGLYPLSRAYRRLGQTEKADAALREFQALDQKDRDAATPGRKRPQ